MGLNEAYWPADESAEVRDITVGDLIREAAADAPDATAMIAGAPGDDRRWTFAGVLADAERVTWALREHLAAYKTPVHWIEVEAFPLTGSGKIQKFVLREQFVTEHAGS